MSRPKHIGEHLKPSDGPLKQMTERAKELTALDKALTDSLGEPLSQHCRLANIRGSTAIIRTDSPAWSARLRYELPRLLSVLNQHYANATLTHIDLRVERPR